MASDESEALSGDLYTLPFEGGSLGTRTQELFAHLLDEHDGGFRDILVIKRFPSGIDTFTRRLTQELGRVGHPNVKSLNRHARTVLAETTIDYDILADFERIEILAHVLQSHEWESEYFAEASHIESFDPDVGRLLLAATWSGGFPDELSDPLLRELQDVQEIFRDKCERLAQGDVDQWLEQAAILQQAYHALEDDYVYDQIKQEFDTVVALEFEEFGPSERRYLARLTRESDLVCIGERHAALARIWNEPGDLENLSDGLTLNPNPDLVDTTEDGLSTHDTVSAFLATGSTSGVSNDDEIYAISEDTFEDQIRTIANEIEYLRTEHGWQYGDFAILFKDSNGPLQETRDILHRVGIPAASATVSGLRDDRAVRELYTVAQYLDHETDAERTEQARQLLEARITDEYSEDFEDLVSTVDSPSSIKSKLETWIVETNLKHRVMATSDEVEIFSQYAHVRDVLDVADFTDRAPFIPNTWRGFRSVFERAAKYVSSDRYSAELHVEEEGVLVDAVRLAKHDRRKTIFIANVVEGEYPSTQRLTTVFPGEWVKDMDDYPGVTNPSRADVHTTYPTAEDDLADEFDAYYAELTRRQLAVGSRAASERLYYCMADRGGTQFRKRRHPSRYLRQLVGATDLEIPVIGDDVERDLYTHGSVSRLVLSQPWDQLSEINQAASVGNRFDVEEAETLFKGIAGLLAEDAVDDRLADAVKTQIDLASGEVGNDVP